ncbi:TetR family transcriptional regulator [Mycobacterium sp. WMMD1722]|uniref:TetR/AcrR family transcriptional regulator n=1 Tax=Mycobacterium sp. WMMD1722 TaxID=3404117 RepID=UPI003BF56001
MRSAADDRTTAARIRDAAIAQFGEHGFDVGVRTIAKAAGVSAALVIHHFGSKENLRAVCDDHIAEEIRSGKSATIQSNDPATWFAQLAEIESYAPMMAYLVRSMQSGSDLAKTLWRRMIDNTEQYLDDGVRAGTVKPSRDAKARARYLALNGSGAFLLYLQLHDNPTNLRQVLHDYAEDMVLPALEIFTNGLLAEPTMYDAFRTQREKDIPFSPGGDDDEPT